MIEVADKFNWVDMGGIDIVKSQGITVDGLFNRLLNSIQKCRYTLLYNWYFAEISIAPTPVELVFDGEEVKINELISVTKEDVVRVYSLETPAEPVLTELIATGNGTYAPEEGVDGFNPVIVNVSSQGFFPSEMTAKFVSDRAPKYSGGYEYSGYIYDTNVISRYELTLLYDASQGASTITLSEPLSNFSGVLLQGIYNKQRKSGYNTTILYLRPELNKAYWAGMLDRKNSYTCHVTFTDDHTATLTGNRQVIVYGIK